VKEYQSKFLDIALKTEALEFGSFTLKSGRQSPYFFNAAKMLNGGNLYDLGHCYADAIMDFGLNFNCIYGPAYKGIFLGSIVSMAFSENGNNYSLSFNRKEEKDHGEGGNIIGRSPQGDVLIIDDVLSAGTAARESIETIKSYGANPKSFIVGLDRQEKGTSNRSAKDQLESDFGISVQSIINLDTLISFTDNNSQYEKHLDELKDYRNNRGA